MEKSKYEYITVEEFCKNSSLRKYCHKCDMAVLKKLWVKHTESKYHLESSRDQNKKYEYFLKNYILKEQYSFEQAYNFGCMDVFSSIGTRISNLYKNMLKLVNSQEKIEDHIV
jgi:hypothetical protein